MFKPLCCEQTFDLFLIFIGNHLWVTWQIYFDYVDALSKDYVSVFIILLHLSSVFDS